MPAKPLIDPGVVSAPDLVQDVNDICEAIDGIDAPNIRFAWLGQECGRILHIEPHHSRGSSSLANSGQNAPWLTSAVSNTGWLQVQGVLDGLDPGSVVVELCANPVPIPGADASGRGEGTFFLRQFDSCISRLLETNIKRAFMS